MSDRRPQPDLPQEDRLFDYGDRLAAGNAPPAGDALEATAARVQQALQSSGPARSMPAHLKTAIWEEIMESTTAGVTAAPSNPWIRANGAQTAPASRTRRRVSRTTPRRATWTWGANVALALLIALMGIGLFQGLGGLDRFSRSNDPTSVPAVSMQDATPEAAATEPAASTVEASGSLTACDLSGDVPIIPDLTEDVSPVDTTSLYVVHNDLSTLNAPGDLMLGCAGEESVLLAENVDVAGPGPWPGTVIVMTLPPGSEDVAGARLSIIDISTGATVSLGEMQGELNAWVEGSPWVIAPPADNSGDLVVIDLRTMESRPLSEVAGIDAPADSMVLMSTSADDGTLAVGFAYRNTGEAVTDGTVMTETGAAGDLLLLGASFDDTQWITTPDSLPRIQAVSLSPDGSHAAVVSMGEGESFPESYRYGLIDMTDGAEIGSSDAIPYMSNPLALWIDSGNSVAYLANTALQTIAVEGNGQPETVFEAESQLNGLQTTWDPSVVVAAAHRDHGSDAAPDQLAQDAVYSINVETGASNEFLGIDASASVGWITDAGALVMYDWDDERPDRVSFRVIDPVTGDQIGTIEDAPSVQPAERTLPTIGPNSVAISHDGRTEVIAIGTQHIYSFVADADGMSMQRVQSPDGLLAEVFLTANVFLSPDGSLLSLNGEEDEGRTRYLSAVADSGASWIGLPNNVPGERGSGMIMFAAGTGN